jgi:metallo-beta-lactamase family protein
MQGHEAGGDVHISFLGAAGTVTGSKYLVETDHTRVLVDCGLFQGLKTLRERNWEPPPVSAHKLDAVLLTHAHLDHSGYLPLLVRAGFRRSIRCTAGTAALARILLLDAAHLQEEDARRANRYHYSRHAPALPLYTTEDAERVLPLLAPVPFDEPFEVGDLRITLVPAGHILGAASLRIEAGGKSVLFSGDVGRPDDLLMRPPRPFGGADVLVVESTYGDRLHAPEDPHAQLAAIVERVCGRGGILLVPAFAVGRSQALLHLLAELTASGAIPAVPTYLNSPMAIDATSIFCAHPGEHKLSPEACRAMCQAAVATREIEESKALNARSGPMILIAGSGMATGGRILHHLRSYGADPRNGILLAGFQAAGTRGAALRDGAQTLKIHGQQVPIRAERFTLDGLSGHADWRELVAWLRPARRPHQVFITHGEPLAADAFRLHLREELGWEARVARDGQTVEV